MATQLRRMSIAGLFVIVVLALAGWAYAQGLRAVQPVSPVVIAGPDLGFRMTGQKGETVVGELVVRVNGEWKSAEFSYGVKRVTQ